MPTLHSFAPLPPASLSLCHLILIPLTREDGRGVVARVVGAEPPPGELFLEDEVARPGVGLEVEPAPRAEGVGAAQQEARVVVQPREDARIVVAVGLRKKNGAK